MKILIDNGHGENTPGKRSPDGTFREYAYTREIADEVVRELAKRGYVAERIVKENLDVPLAERARRVNEICARYGANNVLLVSIHCNAAGNGEWMNARGWLQATTAISGPMFWTTMPSKLSRNTVSSTSRQPTSSARMFWKKETAKTR